MEISTGTRLGPYKILGRVGAGGMGEVYRAGDQRLERDVAIKVLPQELSQNEKALSRFRREAKTLAALSHPNILTIHDIGEHNGHLYVVMELLEGQTLRQYMAGTPISCEQAIDIISEVAEGLAAAHSHGIIHRDLKPENIFVTRDGRVKILDFGLAKRLSSEDQFLSDFTTESQATTGGTILGTLPYMSPEQARGEPLDQQSDIFSTGTILYELLARTMPFQGPNAGAIIYKIIHETPQPPSTVRTEVPEWLDSIVEHALAKEKQKRYSSAVELLDDLRKQQTSSQMEETAGGKTRALRGSALRPRRVVIAIIALLALGFSATWYFDRQTKIRWARQEALPEIERMINQNWRDFFEPYNLAKKAEQYIPNDSRLQELISNCSLRINIKTEPPGANVYMKEYKSPNEEWEFLGVSPLEKVRVPIGIVRWKMEKEGYETTLAAGTTFDAILGAGRQPTQLVRILTREKTIPSGMVRVAGAKTSSGELGDFYIDQFEVTNQKYKEFVDSGGYRNKRYWKHEFIKDGRSLPWEEAMAEFVDATNRPGPATWQGGDYPEGRGNDPVSGISWYEAAAYAEFAGKNLPTCHHWGLARGEATTLIKFPQVGGFAVFAPFSNFGGKGPVPVGSLPGITSYGAYDMAGNVREWCWNETENGRLIRGGAWNDNTYSFKALSQSPPMDRSSKNGFRCALYPDPEKIPEAAFGILKLPRTRDFYKERPVPDAVFQAYKERFSYDSTDLNAEVESRIERPGAWTYEKISLDAAYGSERIISYLFLPVNASPPYQTVVYYPGVGAIFQETSKDIEDYFEFRVFLSFIVKNGRAVLFPVYKGTFERRDAAFTGLHVRDELNSYLWTEFMTQQIKDFKRCVDYLETRPDIDKEKIAYYGMSWGGWLGAVIPAVEKRMKASILLPGGFIKDTPRPEVDQINFVTRVTVPTLMLNGKYDTTFPYETSAKPFFDLLGTSQEDKKLKLYETDHIPPRNEFIKETLAWLDRYLGPVKR